MWSPRWLSSKESPAGEARDAGLIQEGQEDSLETEMVTHSSMPAWKIPWTEEPGGLQPTGPQSQTRLSK